MPVHYSTTAGYLYTTLHIKNTALPSVLSRYEFWLFFGLHLVIGCLYRSGHLHWDGEKLPWNDIKAVAAITTFFQVFYTNQCYHRYCNFYEKTRLMLGNLYDYCFELRLFLANSNGKQHARLASRQIAASVLLFFYEMDDIAAEEWAELQRQGLLKAEEKDFLQQFSSKQHSLIMLQWSAEAARDGCSACKTPANVMKSLTEKLLKCRHLQQDVLDMVSLPLPFQYFHFMKSMVVVNMLFWAWGMAFTRSVFAPAVYWMCLLIFMGMMELAAELSDPFGDDDVDFPVTAWVDEFIENTIMLMEFKNPPDHIKAALESEQALKLKPPGLKLFVERLSSEDDRDFRLESMDEEEGEEELMKPLVCS